MKVRDEFLERVNKKIKKYKMLKLKDRVLVGVSGGPDSICLLQILNKLKAEYGLRLFAFHLNHKLRGKESDGDEKFVKQFCQSRKISCRVKRFAVREYAKKKKLSLEQAAREIRYKLLEQERKRLRCNKIALGHNANDNIETIIINLTRGTGLTGLCGIPPIRDRIIRPLLETERKAILGYLKSDNITYRVDSSNVDWKIPRNFVRTKVLPQLQKLNPNLIETTTKTVAILSGEENYLKDLTREIFKRIVLKKSKNGISIDNTMLLSYNLALRRRFLKFLMPALGYDKIEKILEMSENKTVGTISLTKKLFANREYDRIYFGKPVKRPVNRNISIPIGKSFAVGDMGIEIQTSLKPANLNLANKDLNTEIFDYDKLTPPFYLRYRQPGDRFTPFGGSEKKLKEVLIDDKIPARARARLPLFCDREGILWILGSRRAERARIKPETKKFLTVRIEPWKNPLQKID